jgi:hypothetical protein
MAINRGCSKMQEQGKRAVTENLAALDISKGDAA